MLPEFTFIYIAFISWWIAWCIISLRNMNSFEELMNDPLKLQKEMAEKRLWKLTQKLTACLVILKILTLTVLPRLRSLCLLTLLIKVLAPLLLWKLIRV